jgi:hypothetical protein
MPEKYNPFAFQSLLDFYCRGRATWTALLIRLHSPNTIKRMEADEQSRPSSPSTTVKIKEALEGEGIVFLLSWTGYLDGFAHPPPFV